VWWLARRKWRALLGRCVVRAWRRTWAARLSEAVAAGGGGWARGQELVGDASACSSEEVGGVGLMLVGGRLGRVMRRRGRLGQAGPVEGGRSELVLEVGGGERRKANGSAARDGPGGEWGQAGSRLVGGLVGER
jgi:hypothetical protein